MSTFRPHGDSRFMDTMYFTRTMKLVGARRTHVLYAYFYVSDFLDELTLLCLS